LDKFIYDPTRDKTFFLWFERHIDTFEEDIKGLFEKERKNLLLNAIDDEYQYLLVFHLRNVTNYLNMTYGVNWIGRRELIIWSSRFPNLTSLDFFL